MERRHFFVWVSRTLGAAVAALVTLPGMQYVWSSLQSSRASINTRRRIVRWKDLRPGEPAQFPIVGKRQDAWHVEPNEVIGRVWLVRRDAGDSPAEDGVTAFTSLCPHMGCQVQRQARTAGFVCPCHRAAFDLEGRPEQKGTEKNHAPRGLDKLPCEVVRDETGEWWVEVQYERFEAGLTRQVVKA